MIKAIHFNLFLIFRDMFHMKHIPKKICAILILQYVILIASNFNTKTHSV